MGRGKEQVDRRVADEFKVNDEIPPPIARPTRRQEGQSGQPSSQTVERLSQSRLKEVDLLSSEAPVYQSPYRRARPTPQPQHPVVPSRPAPVSSPQKPQRAPVPASPSALSTSASHKVKGTSAHKLGQYADAESVYSLPSLHCQLHTFSSFHCTIIARSQGSRQVISMVQ